MYELNVEGMSCNHCVSAVTKSIKEIDSNAEVAVDLPGKKVRVQSQAALEAVIDAVTDAGYSVTASAVS
jgi:copper chaperone